MTFTGRDSTSQTTMPSTADLELAMTAGLHAGSP